MLLLEGCHVVVYIICWRYIICWVPQTVWTDKRLNKRLQHRCGESLQRCCVSRMMGFYRELVP